jgi:gliding motility-associated-like protein
MPAKPSFSVLFLLLIVLFEGNFSFAGTGTRENNFQFPHFFTQAPGSDDKYVLRFNKGQMQFGDRHVSFQVIKGKPHAENQQDPSAIMQAGAADAENVVLNFLNANTCLPHGHEPLASRTNYFLGSNSSNWKSDLQNYQSLLYSNLYDNVDLKYYVLNDEVKYDYTVKRGGAVADIKMHYSGIRSLHVDKDGTLLIRTRLTELKDYLPKSYQVIGGKEVPVKVRYRLIGKYTVGFVAEAYDKNYPLIIDPAMIYSTFVGGSADDYEYTGGISLDASGNIYVTGRTSSANFPTTAGAVQGAYAGAMDAFVFKLNPSGTALIFSTFVGGNNVDAGYTTKIDPVTNDVYVAGTTGSVNFPTTPGAFHTAYAGGIYDPFLFKLSAAGNSLIYSTLMGNAQDDYGASLEIDNFGNAYVVGQSSGIYPTTAGAYQSAYGGGTWDVFVTKFNPTGSAVIFSTMLGGASEDHSHSIQVDANYDVYIGGMAKTGFPTTAGVYDQTFNGGQWDMYVTKMNSTGTALIYSTYVGGPGADWTWNGLEIDNAGNAYNVGYAQTGFPTTAGAFQTVYGGGPFDVALFKLNPAGTALIYSTYVGGPGDDEGWGISLNPNNEAFITGLCSFGYPYTPCAWDTTFNGVQDAFISYLDASASSLIYSSYIGGAAYDQGYNIIDVGNLVYVAGATSSVDFPYTTGAYDTTHNVLKDIVVFKMDISGSDTALANFNSVTTVCLNGSIQFNNTSLNATTFAWDFDDGTTSTLEDPQHTFFTSGWHNVQLIASGACAIPDTVIIPINIVDPPVASYTANIPCGLMATFTDASTGAIGYSWDFGDGFTSGIPSPAHTYASDGTYLVTLIATNASGCSDTVQQQVTVSPLASASFNFSPSQCTLLVSLQNTSANATSYAWSFGDGSNSSSSDPSHTYADTGTYTIMLIANPGACADTAFQSVTLHIPPVASFADLPGCDFSIDFLNATPGAVSYAWDFGDGTTSSFASPSHTYATDGNYTVTLIATDVFGCSDTVSAQVAVQPVPVAAFSSSTPQCGLNASFQNTSLNANVVTWYFGDGNSSAASNPSHTYADTGLYSVMLIVNPGQCADTMIQSINVYTAPVAAFTDLALCDLTGSFINNSSGGTAYSWDFGDTQTSTQVSPVHVYLIDGNYTVTLIVQNAFGCSDTALQQIQIDPVPVAAFNFIPPLCTMQVNFQNSSQNASTYLWDFGDGITATGTDVSHVFAGQGNFLITLICNPGSCADTITQSVSIYPPPVSAFTGVAGCNLEYNFVNTSSGGVSYAWDFGDASTSSVTTPSHTYPFAGNYFITLVTIDQYGCNDTAQQNVTIYDNPVALFSYTAPPCTLFVPFENTSGNAAFYQWYFGDGSSSVDASPVHTYPASGTYTVLLIANPGGCSDSVEATLTVNRPPDVSFSEVTSCTFEVIFQNSSDSAVAYSWDFGDGATATDESPSHTYPVIGGHDVTLIGTTLAGCTDTMTRHIEVVVFSSAAYIPVYDTCLRQAQFVSTTTNSATYHWDFGDGTTAQSEHAVHEFPYNGNFEMLFITNSGTPCADTLAQTFDAAPAPEHSFYIPNCFTPNGDGLNERFSVLDYGDCFTYHLTIFNRWGEVIFETSDLGESWDGTYKGAPVPEDVYAWLLKGKDKTKQGSVLVLK